MKVVKRILFLGLLFISLPKQSYGDDSPKLILIHLDSVSSEYFLKELEKGTLPNIQRFFGNTGRIDYTITYFPSKTPTVVSSIRSDNPPGEIFLPGWEWSHLESENVVNISRTFIQMTLSTSRLSFTNIFYGLPIFKWLAGPALINTADYLRDYNVLQFYWYNIDTEGHFNGEDAYLKEFSKFDRQFGKLINRLNDDVNIIIYSDHGMTFGRGVETDKIVKQIAGDDLKIYSYPSLYLNNVDKAEFYAKTLLRQSEIDFTFYKPKENEVKGFHENGALYFHHSGGKVNYEYSGEDVLGYYEYGYGGEYWSREQWLEFSHQLDFPLAPVNIYFFLQNPGAGDVITLYDETKYHQTEYSSTGSHGGFTSKEMTVPLLVRGDEVEKLYNRSYYWLPNLFSDIEGIDFDRHPFRERHSIGSRYDFSRNKAVTEISFSPKYRIHYGASVYTPGYYDFSDFDRIDIWGKADLFRSYLSRLWIGTGFEINNRSESSPFLIFQYDIQIRKFSLKNSFATNRPFHFRVSYQATERLTIENVNLTSLGMRINF